MKIKMKSEIEKLSPLFVNLTSIKAKLLINRCFNIEWYIVMIRGTNMNLGILQCKNCWK